MVLFIILTIGLGIWAQQINSRVVQVKNRMFTNHRPTRPNHVLDQNPSPSIEQKDTSNHCIDSVEKGANQ